MRGETGAEHTATGQGAILSEQHCLALQQVAPIQIDGTGLIGVAFFVKLTRREVRSEALEEDVPAIGAYRWIE